MKKEQRYEVSDGVIGTTTLTGYFTDPMSAYRAFERAHGDFARGVSLIYRLDGDDEVYAVSEDCSIHPMAGIVPSEQPMDYEKLYQLACARADREKNRADRYWGYLGADTRRALAKKEVGRE